MGETLAVIERTGAYLDPIGVAYRNPPTLEDLKYILDHMDEVMQVLEQDKKDKVYRGDRNEAWEKVIQSHSGRGGKLITESEKGSNICRLKCEGLILDNLLSDVDLAEWLSRQENIAAYIKTLIIEDMGREEWRMDHYGPDGHKDTMSREVWSCFDSWYLTRIGSTLAAEDYHRRHGDLFWDAPWDMDDEEDDPWARTEYLYERLSRLAQGMDPDEYEEG